MIDEKVLSELKVGKNLLAFSYGIDSTALFFILEELEIVFDIAIIDYGVRESAKEEVAQAQKLAKEYNKQIFIKQAPKFKSNFEKSARDLRYDFFNQLCLEHNYTHLLTAHQLNDKLEWFLMELSKGAGMCELSGMSSLDSRDNYTLVRPLLKYSKKELREYLLNREKLFFLDESNQDLKHKRNYFRKEFANKFLEEFQDGVTRSFEYIEKDCALLLDSYQPQRIEDLYILDRKAPQLEIKEIDLTLKKMGYILSKPQKDEIIKTSEIVIGGKIAISKTNRHIFINPYITNLVMEKDFKEKCRTAKIPNKSRQYIYFKGIDLKRIKEIIHVINN